MRAQPYKIELLKSGLMALIGLLAVLQPWILLVRLVGWLLLFFGGALFIALSCKVLSAKRVLRAPIARFRDGSVICEHGVLFEGQLYNFSTFGTTLTGLDLMEDRIVFAYRYITKGNARGHDVLAVPFEPDERPLAEKAAAFFQLPPIDHAAEAENAEAGQIEEPVAEGPATEENAGKADPADPEKGA